MKKYDKNIIWILGLLLIIFMIGCDEGDLGSNPKNKNTIVLYNGTLINGTGETPVENSVVVVKDEQIIDVGIIGEIETPKDAEFIDLNGATILPGFINSHAHYVYDSKVLNTFAMAGVTTVRDMQDNDSTRMENWSWFDYRDDLNMENYNSRLVAVGPMISVENGYPAFGGNETEKFLNITSVEDAKIKTQKLIDKGADVIKISVETGITFWQQDPLPKLSEEEIKAIINTAHANNIKVAAHITHSIDLDIFITNGGDEIGHMVIDENLSDDLINQMVENDVYWGPTLELWKYVQLAFSDKPGFNYYPNAVNNLKRFVRAGGKVALGSDYGGFGQFEFQMGMPMLEIEGMLEAEMTPMQIIVASTKNAAYVCNMEDKIGTIEKGKIADILVVDGDPLMDIQSLNKPLLVIHNGEIINNKL